VSGLVHAIAFLTRVPVRHHPADARDRARSVPWFPVVGAMVGASMAGVYALLEPRLPTLGAAALALAVGMVVTGALHEDGLADAVDGIAGGHGPEDRLRIMKDSRHGTFGVLALGTVLVLRVSCLGALDAWNGLAALVAAYALGRAAVLLLMRGPTAGDGLGAGYTAAVTPVHVVAGAAAGMALAAIAAGWAGLVISPCAAAAALLTGLWARRAIGGITGDVLGAAEQVAELTVLTALAGWAASGSHTLAWWR
jgi:adenosylcobinamide-GDP ribazoletransferase